MPDQPSTAAARPASEPVLRQQVGRRLMVRRTWLELSQQEVADRAGISRNFVSAIERAAQGLDAWRLWSMADVLGVSLDNLLTGPDNAMIAAAPDRPADGAVA